MSKLFSFFDQHAALIILIMAVACILFEENMVKYFELGHHHQS